MSLNMEFIGISFFTLAFVSLFISLLSIPIEYNAIGGLALIFGYQFALSSLGWADYIEHHPRTNLFNQNKEGLLSGIGYTSLFLFGARLGRELLKPRSNLQQWRQFTGVLWVVNVLLWCVTIISDSYIEPSSRRMANLSYVLSVITLNTYNIASALTVACITRPTTNTIIEAVNYNGLAIFLLANISTGIVNKTIQTIYTSDGVAILILTFYMVFVSGVSVLLYRYKIHLKFW